MSHSASLYPSEFFFAGSVPNVYTWLSKAFCKNCFLAAKTPKLAIRE